MSNLDKVREALGKIGFFDREDMKAMDAALSALSAHEEVVRELVEALKDAVCALEVCGKNYDYVMDKARAALCPFTGDEK